MFGAWANHSLQSSNLSDELKAQGLTTVNGLRSIADVSGLIGGPVARRQVVVRGLGPGEREHAPSRQPLS